MKKTISLFQRNYDGDRLVRDEIVPGAEWVVNGEGVATRKYDGTCCMVRDGKLYKRYDKKPNRNAPEGFEPAGQPDTHTGRVVGWVPVGDGPEDKWHREAFERLPEAAKVNGTYELLGPKIQGNPEKVIGHGLLKHSDAELLDGCPRDFDGIKEHLKDRDIEGIVWHHPDGRFVKIKKKDFGMKR